MSDLTRFINDLERTHQYKSFNAWKREKELLGMASESFNSGSKSPKQSTTISKELGILILVILSLVAIYLGAR